MPLDLKTKLSLAQTDPSLITWVFNNGPAPEDIYLYQRFGGNFLRYEEMLIDPQVGGKLDERVGALLGRAVLVNAASKDKSDVDAANKVKKILDIADDESKSGKNGKKKKPLIPYEQICGNWLNSGLLIGFSVQALEWEERDGMILPELEFVPQRRFVFRYRDPENKDIYVCTDEKLDPAKDIVFVNGYELRLLTRRSPIEGERCPRNRFICYTYGSMKGLPQGLGLGYRIRKFYEIRKEVLRSGVLTGDRLGSPPVHGTYPMDLNPQNPADAIVLGAFERLLKAISPNAYASTTEAFKINFLEPKTGGYEILKWLYDTAALEITRAVWGEGSYSEKETGSYSAEQQQAQNRNENVVDADCNSLDEGPCARLWELIGDYNWPNAASPIIRRETESERRRLAQEQQEEERQEAKRNGRVISDRTLILDIGLTTTDKYIKETYGEAFTLPETPSDNSADNSFDATSDNPSDNSNDNPPDESTDIPELTESANFGSIIDRVLKWNGLDIGVEYLPGMVRFPGRKNSKKLRSGYGHIRNHLGADGNALDCYIHSGLLPAKGGEPQGSDRIFEVSQVSPKNGDFDEHKYMLGYDSLDSAKSAYLTEMPSDRFGRIREVAIADLAQYKRNADNSYSELLAADSVFFSELERVIQVEFSRSAQKNCRQGFPCRKGGGTGTCISKLKTCVGAAPGQPTTHKEYVDGQLKALSAAGRLSEADAILYTARRIARTPSEPARAKLINSLRNRLEKDEQLNAVLESIDIESGIKNPKQLAANISQFKIPEDSKSGLVFAYGVELKPLSYSDQKLNSVSPTSVEQQRAIALGHEYLGVTKELDSLLAKTKAHLSDDEYAASFSKTQELAERLKNLSDKGKTLVGKVNQPELDEYVNQIARISKEALPGYQIILPTDLNRLKEKARRLEC